jgi:hypothetical protein
MPTTHFGFDQLSGSDAAGYVSINNLLTDIDSILNTRFGGIINTTNYSALTVGDAGKVIEWSGSAFTTGLIDNANISATAGIVDTKLATITTAGKVANSATTASSSNGANTIVSRDSAGNFAADTITASLSGTATSASNLVGGSAGSVPYQTGTSTTGMLANGTAGQVLTSNGGSLAPSWQAASIGNSNIAGNAVTQDKMADNSVGTAEIIDANVTYAKLATDVKKFSVATSATAGVYFTSNGTLTTASLANNTVQQPLVIVNSASNIILQLPYDLGSIGDSITICRIGTGQVTIQCNFGGPGGPGGYGPIFLGGYVLALIDQSPGIVTLICVGADGTGPGGATRDWVVSGDYILD